MEVAACNSQQLWGWDVFHVLVRRTEAGSARALMLCAVDGFCVEGWGCFSSFFFLRRRWSLLSCFQIDCLDYRCAVHVSCWLGDCTCVDMVGGCMCLLFMIRWLVS